MTTQPIQINDSFSQTFTIQPNQTAKYLGSGNLEVFATPAMIACIENTALRCIAKSLAEGTDSVGTEINVKHLKASAVGETITFEAKVIEVEGKKVNFEITATNASGNCVGTGNHTRYIIDIKQFLSKLKKV